MEFSREKETSYETKNKENDVIPLDLTVLARTVNKS